MANRAVAKKGNLHPRNVHQGRYDFKKLCAACPQLTSYLIKNPRQESTINFSDALAVKTLNQALLNYYYQVKFWQIPDGYLCPPIPGRADYIHYLADLLAQGNGGELAKGKQVKVLDIGSGANCIYPILGSQIYGWSFVGSDIDPVSIKSASLIIEANKNLKPYIKLRRQKNASSIFDGIIKPQDSFSLTMCNPPFHESMQKAREGSMRKVQNLNKRANSRLELNFGGQKNELCCEGGEIAFLKRMCHESKNYAQQVTWFTSLVSKAENIAVLKKVLQQLSAKQVQVIKMSQGQKISRLIAWRF